MTQCSVTLLDIYQTQAGSQSLAAVIMKPAQSRDVLFSSSPWQVGSLTFCQRSVGATREQTAAHRQCTGGDTRGGVWPLKSWNITNPGRTFRHRPAAVSLSRTETDRFVNPTAATAGATSTTTTTTSRPAVCGIVHWPYRANGCCSDRLANAALEQRVRCVSLDGSAVIFRHFYCRFRPRTGDIFNAFVKEEWWMEVSAFVLPLPGCKLRHFYATVAAPLPPVCVCIYVHIYIHRVEWWRGGGSDWQSARLLLLLLLLWSCLFGFRQKTEKHRLVIKHRFNKRFMSCPWTWHGSDGRCYTIGWITWCQDFLHEHTRQLTFIFSMYNA